MDNARLEAKNLVDKAQLEAESIVKDANYEKAHIRQSILRLLDKRDEIISGISIYLENAATAVQKFKTDDMKIFSLEDEVEKPEEPAQTKEKKDKTKESASTKFTFDDEADNDTFLKDNSDSSFPPGSDRLDDILDEID